MLPTTREKRIEFGFFLLLLWCLISAFSRVYTGDAEQLFNPIALCFYVSLFSSIVFILMSIKNFKTIITKVNLHHRDVIGINLSTVGCWFFLFYPLKFLEPSIVSALALSTTPLTTLLVSRFLYRRQNINQHDYIVAMLAFMVAGYLIVIGFLGDTAVKHIPVIANILSISCCYIVSIALAFNNIYIKRLSDTGFLPLEILSVRFFLLVLFSGISILFIKNGRTLDTFSLTFMVIMITAFTVLIIPQLIYQPAVRELQPISIAMVIPIMPVITFFIEFHDARLNPNTGTILGILTILGITLFGTFLRYHREKKYLFKND